MLRRTVQRFVLVAAIVLFGAACADDPPELPDASGPEDAGTPDRPAPPDGSAIDQIPADDAPWTPGPEAGPDQQTPDFSAASEATAADLTTPDTVIVDLAQLADQPTLPDMAGQDGPVPDLAGVPETGTPDGPLADLTGTDGSVSDLPPPDGPLLPSAVHWVRQLSGTGADGAESVAADNSGNIYVTGAVNGPVDLGCGTLPSSGGSDLFLVSYSPSGSCRWARRFGGTGEDGGQGVAVDISGTVTVTGYFEGTANFGGTPLSSAGTEDIILASYDAATGSHLWSKCLGGTGSDRGNGVAVDSNGDLVVTGQFTGGVDFGGGKLNGGGPADIFLSRFSSSGGHLWSKAFGGPQFDIGEDVSIDSNANIYLTGRYAGTVSFGSATLKSNGGSEDIVLASYDATGNYRWASGFGGPIVSDTGLGVATDSSGNLYLAGEFRGTTDFGGGPVSATGGIDSVLLSTATADGSYRWLHDTACGDLDRAVSVSVDPSGTVYAAGEFVGSADFGDGPVTSVGNQDIYVVSLTPAGVLRWKRQLGGADADLSADLVATSTGVYVVGSFRGTVDFGTGPLSTPNADPDGLVVKLSP